MGEVQFQTQTEASQTSALDGDVLVNDEPGKRHLIKFCKKQIEHWIRDHASASRADFKVSITEDPQARQVSCVTEIRLGEMCWRGFDLDQDTQRAFMHSLKHLQPH